jgi:hypothetical protein
LPLLPRRNCWLIVAIRPSLVTQNAVDSICCRCYISGVLIDWSDEFDLWLDRLVNRVDSGDAAAAVQLDLVTAELEVLQALVGEPAEESATLKRVRQSGKHLVWRVAHPYVDGVALRLVVWFPLQRPDEVVVALFAGDKANMGDVFYNSVGSRADAAIDRYQRRIEGESR